VGALYGSGVAKRPPRQKQAAGRARRRQRERRDGLTSGGSADLVEYRGWVGSVLERARRGRLGLVADRAGVPRKPPFPAGELAAESGPGGGVCADGGPRGDARWLACERAVTRRD